MSIEKASSKKANRIDIRVSTEHKELLEAAAAMKGLSLSAYILSESLAAARRDSQQTLVLSDRDRDSFLKAMSNQPRANNALKAAIEEYTTQYED